MYGFEPPSPGPADDGSRRLSASKAAWEYLGLTLEEFTERWRVGQYAGLALPPVLTTWVDRQQ